MSPDGNRIAFVETGSFGRNLKTYNLENRTITILHPDFQYPLKTLTWNPTVDKLAFVLNSKVWVGDVADKEINNLRPVSSAGVDANLLGWSSDGKEVYFIKSVTSSVAGNTVQKKNIYSITVDTKNEKLYAPQPPLPDVYPPQKPWDFHAYVALGDRFAYMLAQLDTGSWYVEGRKPMDGIPQTPESFLSGPLPDRIVNFGSTMMSPLLTIEQEAGKWHLFVRSPKLPRQRVLGTESTTEIKFAYWPGP